jgi:cytochrome c
MRRTFTIPLLLLLGCTQSSDVIDGNAVTAPVELRFEEADLDRGEILSLACQACHTLDAGQADLLGPNLYGMFGRVSAGAPGFGYSAVLRSANLIWTPRALDAWLASPEDFLPGNDMAFAGYNSATDRRDLIAFLLHKTGGVAE